MYINKYIYMYTVYILTTHNPILSLDLPLRRRKVIQAVAQLELQSKGGHGVVKRRQLRRVIEPGSDVWSPKSWMTIGTQWYPLVN